MEGTNNLNQMKVKNNILDSIIFYTLLIMLIVIPITVRYNAYNFTSPLITEIGIGSGEKFEIFNYYKWILVLVTNSVLIGCMLIKILTRKFQLKETKVNYFIYASIFFVSISMFVSPIKNVAIFGFVGRFEGALSYISYLLILLTVIHTQFTKKQFWILLFASVPFIIVNLLFGLLNFYQRYFINRDFELGLLHIPKQLKLVNDAFLQTTVFSTNLISGVASFLFALFFTVTLFHKKKGLKVVSLLVSTCTFLLILVSSSTGGFITFLVFFILILASSFLYNRSQIVMNGALTALFVLISSLAFVQFGQHNPIVWNESVGVFVKHNPFENGSNVAKTNEGYSEKSQTRSPVNKTPNGETTQNNKYLPNIPKMENTTFSGREFIWKSTIKVWMKNPFFGNGLDTLPFYVDQNSFEKMKILGSKNYLATPHNVYLGWLYGFGIFGTVSIFSIIGYALYGFMKKLFQKPKSVIFISLGFGFMAYLVQGLVYDTTIGVSVFFWIYLGLLLNLQIGSKSTEQLEKDSL